MVVLMVKYTPICLTTKKGFRCNYDKCKVPKCLFGD